MANWLKHRVTDSALWAGYGSCDVVLDAVCKWRARLVVIAMAVSGIGFLAAQPVAAGGTSTRPAEGVEAIERLARTMRWLPPEFIGPSTRIQPLIGAADITALRRAVQQAGDLPLELAKAKDPTIRGLTGLVFGLSADMLRVAAAVELLTDEAATTLRAVPIPHYS